MKLSYSTWGMKTTPVDVAIRHCADLGFDGLELTIIPGWPTDAADLTKADRLSIRQQYDAAGLELCGFSGNIDLLAADWESVRATFCGYLDLAAEMQKAGEHRIVTTTSGGTADEWEMTQHEIAERLGVVSAYAHRVGVMVGIEPHVGSSVHLPEHAIWMMEQVASPGLTLHFDISHFNVQGIPMAESIRLLAPHALHTHVKDERGLAPDHQFLIPGEGDMDYAGYLKEMSDAGYSGHIVVEISLMVQARPNYDALSAATQSYNILSAAFQEAQIGRT
ncbi:MAG TPA: sugar phosphate isomerase/epimerase [Thermomicrobiales bacterium]|nr:sugar phosphate isomerase/epimerase [Thermomicrobiales bacterium]